MIKPIVQTCSDNFLGLYNWKFSWALCRSFTSVARRNSSSWPVSNTRSLGVYIQKAPPAQITSILITFPFIRGDSRAPLPFCIWSLGYQQYLQGEKHLLRGSCLLLDFWDWTPAAAWDRERDEGNSFGKKAVEIRSLNAVLLLPGVRQHKECLRWFSFCYLHTCAVGGMH